MDMFYKCFIQKTANVLSRRLHLQVLFCTYAVPWLTMLSSVPNFINGIQLKESFKAELLWERGRGEEDQKKDWNSLELNLLWCSVLIYNKKKNLFPSQQAAEAMVTTITWD